MQEKATNRIYKFRAWDKKQKKMYFDVQEYYDTLGYDSDDIPTDCYETFNCFLNNKYQNVMQYIGIKDKNNKKIFENDLVKIDDGIFQIKYFATIAGYSTERNNYALHYSLGTNGAKLGRKIYPIEIIGNIYENIK